MSSLDVSPLPAWLLKFLRGPSDPHQRRVRSHELVGNGKRCHDKAKKAARKIAEASRRRNRA